ncbi:MAG TPA: M23 family metallopeptidase [Allosphingosinicella sp.]|nr:M23 family metallopeptidase [Allosphingosinicella sp.]
MTNLVQAKNVPGARKFRNFFRPRDFFFHDGRSLRRISIGVPVQISAALAALLLVLWSAFAAAQLFAAPPANAADVARMERQVEAMQADVQAIKAAAEQRYQLTEREVRKLGIDPKRFTGTGGPFEAVQPLKADPKFKQLFMSWKKLDQIEQGTIAIPSTQPVRGTSLTSGYGVRSDPFRGRAAMHAGIDLAGPLGTPIYATADGFVQRSEWVGGYGNLVELNHGRGIQTRFGHLSRSMVRAGQRVKRGDLIAYMGSTGRSTGSHLHYEVRIDGKAVNPVPFMQSNDYLLAVQRRAAAATRQVAMGGPRVPTK